MRFTATGVCRALRDDRDPASGWVRDSSGAIVRPPEVWLADAGMWVRASGQCASGWRDAKHTLTFFGPISALRIRRAIRSWAAQSSEAQPLGSAERSEPKAIQSKPNPNPNLPLRGGR